MERGRENQLPEDTSSTFQHSILLADNVANIYIYIDRKYFHVEHDKVWTFVICFFLGPCVAKILRGVKYLLLFNSDKCDANIIQM